MARLTGIAFANAVAMKPALLIGLIAMSGCVTEEAVDEPAATELQSRTARQRFDQDVAPILRAKCGACHTAPNSVGPAFVVSDPTTMYLNVVTNPRLVADFTPANAPILQVTRISGHATLRYDSVQTTQISGWLDQETLERR
jgi:hypothetical protein